MRLAPFPPLFGKFQHGAFTSKLRAQRKRLHCRLWRLLTKTHSKGALIRKWVHLLEGGSCIPKGKPKIVESRQFRNFHANSFHADLNLAPWHLVHPEDNPNRAWEIWSRPVLETCDFHAPKCKRIVRNNYAPWLTPEIKRLMFERDKLKRAAITNNSDAHWTEYKIAPNNVKC